MSTSLRGGQDEAATANGPTDEEPDKLWMAALNKAKLEGGDDSTVQQNTIKMYRGLKRKLKSKQKQPVEAA